MNTPIAEIDLTDGGCLHLYEEDGEWAIWLDTEPGVQKLGLCIGCSNTRNAAIRDAERLLRTAAEAVNNLAVQAVPSQ